MNVADLFVNIGVKGKGQAFEALSTVNKGLESVASSGLLAKAALVGALYAFERLTNASGERGTALQKFANFTGLSTDMLQKWQVVLRQAGVSAEDTTQAFQGLQAKMIDMLAGKGAPAGFSIISKAVGIDPSKVRDTAYMMEKMREYAHKEPNKDWANQQLMSMGFGPDFIQGLRTSKMALSEVKPSQILSSSEIAKLNQVDVAWKNLFASMKMFQDHVVSGLGGPLISELNGALSTVKALTDAFMHLGKAGKVISGVAAAMGVLAASIAIMGGPLTALAAAVTGLIYLFGEWDKFKKGKDSFFTFLVPNKEDLEKEKNMSTSDKLKKMMFGGRAGGALTAKEMGVSESERQKIMKEGSDKINKQMSATVTVHNHGVKDAKDSAGHMKKAVQDAFRQIPAQAQGN